MEPFISDHILLFLHLEEAGKEGPKPYRFYNYVAELPKFLIMVKRTWNTTTKGQRMKGVWQKLKAVKQEMKKMHTEEFKKVRESVQLIRRQFQEIQEQMHDPSHQTSLADIEKEL